MSPAPLHYNPLPMFGLRWKPSKTQAAIIALARFRDGVAILFDSLHNYVKDEDCETFDWLLEQYAAARILEAGSVSSLRAVPPTPPKCDAEKSDMPVETFPFNYLVEALDGVLVSLNSGPCRCDGEHPLVTDDQVRRLIATCQALAASRASWWPWRRGSEVGISRTAPFRVSSASSVVRPCRASSPARDDHAR